MFNVHFTLIDIKKNKCRLRVSLRDAILWAALEAQEGQRWQQGYR
jgi:hypothetical protein